MSHEETQKAKLGGTKLEDRIDANSSPARFKLVRQTFPLASETRKPVDVNKQRIFSDAKIKRKQEKFNSRQKRHRHSNVEMRSEFYSSKNHCSENSASSSTASDSAFSRSQTTLGSESDRSSTKSFGFSHNHDSPTSESLKGDDGNSRFSIVSDRRQSETIKSNSLQAGEDREENFKIIWRNLSYRVPEKRFSKLSTFFERHKAKLTSWCQSEEDNSSANGEEFSENHLTSSSISPKDQCPPLKPPTTGKPRRVIFENLNGCVRSGQLTAILGPSGAGKTTFLKCLTNKIVKGVSGSIDVVGGSKSNHHLKLCIIPQKDYLFDNLTVMENLLFASRIKNTQLNFEHMNNVDRVAKLLGLQSCLKLKTSKLSGGQYKRVSIAQELLSKPDILILDEPTSGLDSLTCFRTVSVLKDLVDLSKCGLISPLAIVMTIHQPQIKIFNLFHHVYIMSSIGNCVYEGKPDHLVDTVANCCGLLPPADDLNPASFIIDLASEVYGVEPINKLTNLQLENSGFANTILFNSGKSNYDSNNNFKSTSGYHSEIAIEDGCQKNSKVIRVKKNPTEKFIHDSRVHQIGAVSNQDSLNISDRLISRHAHDNSFWLHTSLLVKRLWISAWRDPLLTTTRITFHFLIPFVFYFIYSQKSGAANACPYVEREFDFQTMTSKENIQRLEAQHNELILTFENVSLFFLLLYSFSMCVLAVTALSFPLNMQILLKETSNGWYSMPRFVMAKTLADLPIELTMPVISVSIAYYMTGQPSSYFCWRMLIVTAVMTLCSLISQTQGLLFGAYFMNNVQAAVFISQASSLPWILLSGFTTRISELTTVLQWLSFGSIYRLGIESIVAVRYGFGMCPCDEEIVNLNNPAKIVGIPEQLRSLMRYYMDMYTTSDTPSTTLKNSTEDVFEKIASTLSRANTYGMDITKCHDVRPFILSAREVDESTLPTFLLILFLIFIGLKILLFWVVRLRAG